MKSGGKTALADSNQSDKEEVLEGDRPLLVPCSFSYPPPAFPLFCPIQSNSPSWDSAEMTINEELLFTGHAGPFWFFQRKMEPSALEKVFQVVLGRRP